MHRLYDEQDCVYKGANINETIDYYFQNHTPVPGSRNQLNQALTRAKESHEAVISGKTGLTAAWDNRNQEYLLISKDEYSPANLASVLFDLLVEEPESSGLDDALDEVDDLVERYLGRIERMEELELGDEKQQLKSIMRTMRESIAMVDETELSAAELERLSEQIDSDYYAPAAEILEKVLDRVAIPLKIVGSEN
jgi:hypothetical protein